MESSRIEAEECDFERRSAKRRKNIEHVSQPKVVAASEVVNLTNLNKNKAASQPKKAAPNKKTEKIRVGDVGYEFRKRFDAGWFSGRVVEIRPGASELPLVAFLLMYCDFHLLMVNLYLEQWRTKIDVSFTLMVILRISLWLISAGVRGYNLSGDWQGLTITNRQEAS